MKNRLNIIIVLLYFLAFLSTTTILGASKIETVPKRDESTSIYTNDWRDLSQDPNLVNAIIRQTFQIKPYEYTKVSQTMLADLNKDTMDELAVAVDRRCSSDPVLVVVFYKDGTNVKAQYCETEHANIQKDFRDLNNNGRYELITRSTVTSSTCHAEVIPWPDIYDLSSGKYVKASNNFTLYYTDLVDKLQKELKEINDMDPNDLAQKYPNALGISGENPREKYRKWKEYRMADHYVIIDKARRLLGEKKAGFDRAKQWLLTGDRQLKKNAITVFTDIGDANSITYLETASRDSDEMISKKAKIALRKLGK